MALRLKTRFWPIHVSGGFLFVHAAGIVLFPGMSDVFSYVCLGLVTLFPVAGSWHQMRDSTGALRLAWRLWIAALLLRAMTFLQDGLLLSGYAPPWWQFKAIVIGSVVIAMVLLAISYTADEHASSRIRLVEGLVALTISLLIDANIFLPAIRLTEDAKFLSFVLVMYTFVAFVSVVAVFGGANTRIRRFHRLIAIYLVTQCIVALLVNNLFYVLLHHHRSSAIDLLIDMPPLLFGCVAFLKPLADAKPLQRSAFSYLIQSTMPFVPGIAAFLLGIRLVAGYPVWGVCGMTLAVVGSGFRAIVVQSQYLARQESIELKNAELQELTERDALTGTGNRLAFERGMRRAWNEWLESGRPFALLMIDVDYLKTINDTFGHARGDTCLMAVGRALRVSSMRSRGHLSRIGGDEFALILHGSDLDSAILLGEKARSSVEALAFDAGWGRDASLSIGISSQGGAEAQFAEPEEMIEAADRALYRAKGRGRNCVVAHFQDLINADAADAMA